jgi:hypothetical protein
MRNIVANMLVRLQFKLRKVWLTISVCYTDFDHVLLDTFLILRYTSIGHDRNDIMYWRRSLRSHRQLWACAFRKSNTEKSFVPRERELIFSGTKQYCFVISYFLTSYFHQISTQQSLQNLNCFAAIIDSVDGNYFVDVPQWQCRAESNPYLSPLLVRSTFDNFIVPHISFVPSKHHILRS